MFKKIFLAAAAVLVLGLEARAGGGARPDPLAGSPVYSDPVFQDYIETAYGYLSPAGRLKPAPVFRDAVASTAAAASVRVSVNPGKRSIPELLKELSAAGFVFSGERTSYSRGGRKTSLLGFASPEALAAIRRVPGVAGIRVGGKKGSARSRQVSFRRG